MGFSMTLEDPDNRAVSLRALFPAQADSQFICDVPFTFSHTVSDCNFSCDRGVCMDQCNFPLMPIFQVQAENCSAEKVEVVSGLSWRAFSKQKTDLTYGETWLEDFISSTDYFIIPTGVFEIQFVTPGRPLIWVDENGEEHNITGVMVFLVYKQTPASSGVSFDLILDPEKRGIEQILYFGRPNQDEYFIKKWGLLQ